MGHKALGRTLTARESLARQALGLGVLVLAVGTAYAVSRVAVADSAEHQVEIVAEEPASSPPAVDTRDINTHIVEVGRRHGVEPKLIAAIVAVESQFKVRAVSRRGAEGLAAPGPPKGTRVTYAGRAVSAPMTPAPARAEELVGAPPEKKKSESP